jgi:hypothetical protein
MAAAGLTGLLAVSSAQAVVNNDLAAINSDYATSITDWYANPTQYAWNPVNARPGSHPDREDGVVYIFADATAADAYWDPTSGDPVPTHVPDTAVAFVHWALDNDSGEFPGIMAKTGDTDFNLWNCIMASGATIPDGDDPNDLPDLKTCGNDQGSAKRFKMTVLQTNANIDLVFNVADQPLELDLIPEDTDVDADNTDGLHPDQLVRIYRILFKWNNGTATDVSDGGATPTITTQDGERISNFTVSVIGNSGLTFDTNADIDGVYLNKDDQLTNASNRAEVEIWSAAEFATVSPSMFSIDGDDRSANGGFWDDAPAGFVNPTTGATSISSGNIASNYSDIQSNQASSLSGDFGTLFGPLVYQGILAEDDTGLLPVGIYIDEDGDPASEGGILAWWDGYDFRWGVDGATRGVYGSNPSDAWTVVSDAVLAQAAYNELDEHATAPFSGPKYEIGYVDDMSGLNTDVYVRLDASYDTTNPSTFILRLNATPYTGTPLEDPHWTLDTNQVPTLEELRAALPDPGDTGDTTTTTSGGGGGGCTIGTGSAWNITMPAILAALLGYGFFRRRRNSK